MCLVYTAEGGGLGPETAREYPSVSRAMKDAGVFVAGARLQPAGSATTVRIREGETLLTDGPFAEIKEQLGGVFLLDCADLDEALRWAATIPVARYGSVEVRPVMGMDLPR
jgi:hypothetical protein